MTQVRYEEELVQGFGARQSLATYLRFPVFIGSFTTTGERALSQLYRDLPPALRRFIAEWESSLDPSVANDRRYEFRLRVFQELAPKPGPDALPIQFTRFDDMDQAQRAAVEQAGRKGLVVVRERQRSIVGLNLLKPKQVQTAVEQQIAFRFSMNDFAAAWRSLAVRPPRGAASPEKTDEKYALYDKPHGDYVYTGAFVEKLVRDCATVEGFSKTVGRPPKPKAAGNAASPTPAVADSALGHAS